MAKEKIKPDKSLVSKCGLYCGSCKRYLKGKCVGCADNHKAIWCKPRTCCIENRIPTCAQCREYDDPMECKKLNNFLSRFFGVIFNSNRRANIEYIQKKGVGKYAKKMAKRGEPTFKRK